MKLNGCVFVFGVTGAALMAQQTVVTQRSFTVSPLTVSVIGGEMVGGPAVSGAPYSAEAVTETTQTLADGNRIVSKTTSKIYRDSAGRERREQSLPNFEKLAGETGPAMIMISDPVAKVNYSLDTRNKSAEKMPAPGPFTATLRTAAGDATFTRVLPAPGARGARGRGNEVFYTQGRLVASQEQIKTEDLGKRTIEGVSVDGTRETTTIPAGQVGNERPIDVVSERWYSPELQVLVMSKNTDPRMGETIYQLTNVSRVEPLPSLFEVPPDFQLNDVTNGMQRVYRRTETVEHTGKDE